MKNLAIYSILLLCGIVHGNVFTDMLSYFTSWGTTRAGRVRRDDGRNTGEIPTVPDILIISEQTQDKLKVYSASVPKISYVQLVDDTEELKKWVVNCGNKVRLLASLTPPGELKTVLAGLAKRFSSLDNKLKGIRKSVASLQAIQALLFQLSQQLGPMRETLNAIAKSNTAISSELLQGVDIVENCTAELYYSPKPDPADTDFCLESAKNLSVVLFEYLNVTSVPDELQTLNTLLENIAIINDQVVEALEVTLVKAIKRSIKLSSQKKLGSLSNKLEKDILRLQNEAVLMGFTPCTIPLPAPRNGSIIMAEDGSVGSFTVFDCNEGFSLNGSQVRQCAGNETWTGDETRCFWNPVGIDECESNPCTNNGTCVDRHDAFECVCLPGYEGATCNIDTNECLSNPCQNGAECIDNMNFFTCNCSAGYRGILCQFDINECASNPCQNKAVCEEGIDLYTCTCEPGYTGVNCEMEIDECVPNPCMNNGTCTDFVNRFKCDCAQGWAGLNCELAWNNTCKPLFAPRHGRIIQDGGGRLNSEYIFECDQGWTMIGSPVRRCSITSRSAGFYTGIQPYCYKFPEGYGVTCPVWDDEPEEKYLFRDALDCKYFYKCTYDGSAIFRFNCPANLHWDDELKVCNWKWAAECTPIEIT
ncbi:unnamed protein product [Owenia fusiformis]|uniref:Uncharacterized protein n=1 Tax=Owenia fusiformis TaxID=6347 RepID=A0A8J1UYW8_OWEFU|nr:unnamed protein product [Owenia fusiformis]